MSSGWSFPHPKSDVLGYLQPPQAGIQTCLRLRWMQVVCMMVLYEVFRDGEQSQTRWLCHYLLAMEEDEAWAYGVIKTGEGWWCSLGGNGRLLGDQIWYICNNKLYFIEKSNPAAVRSISVKHKTHLDMNEQAKKTSVLAHASFPLI